MLPEDLAGNVDWVQAWRDGVIQPRPIAPRLHADSVLARGFGFDLYLASEDGPEAYFPHSVHEEWLNCVSCHPRVYRTGNRGDASAQLIHEEGSCATCHRSVAFPMQACERCHSAATGLPSGRVDKVLGEVLHMTREAVDSDGDDGSELYSAAIFPHGEHRLRFQCRACHERPFAMEAGGTVLGRDAAHSSDGCGACHDGITAFATNMDACHRCHLEEGG
jgi:c(7)-type cytochrome triheme protein